MSIDGRNSQLEGAADWTIAFFGVALTGGLASFLMQTLVFEVAAPSAALSSGLLAIAVGYVAARVTVIRKGASMILHALMSWTP